MGELVLLLIFSFLSATMFLSLVFLFGFIKQRYDVIDSAWGPTFIVIVFFNLVAAASVTWTAWLGAALVTVWGVRLGYHVFHRFQHSTSEDARYVELRKKWPKRYLRLQIFIRIYLVQAILATLILLPVIIIIHASSPPVWAVIVGVCIWLFGFMVERAADQQLRNFLRQPGNKGVLMTQDLWHYSRHPNYFGEILLWWGIGIISLGTNMGFIGLIGPITITLLIRFISGVPPAEKSAAAKKGWEEYKAHTRMLIPLPK